MVWLQAALALAVLLFIPGLREQFEAPKAAVVGVCGAGAWAWAIARGWRGVRLGLLDAAVLGWLGVEILATAWSVDPLRSLFGETSQREGLITSAALAGLYLGARFSLGAASTRTARDLLLAATAVSCVYALLQAARLDPIQWARTASYGPGGWIRPFGTLGHPNLLGAVSAAATVLALGPALRGERRWLYAPVALLCAAATALTFSRAAWLGAIAGAAVTASLAWRARSVAPAPARALALAGVGLLALAGLFAAGGWEKIFAPRISELGTPASGTAASRLEIWRAALDAWRARPLLGQGPDTFELVFPRHQTREYWLTEWAGLPVHAHSVYLHTLATRGALGALAASAWALAACARLLTMWRAGGQARRWATDAAGAACAVGIAGAFGAIGVTGVLILVFLSAVVAAAVAARDEASVAAVRSEPSVGAEARHLRVASVTAAVAATLAASWFAIDLGASRAAARARSVVAIDPALAAESARLACFLEPRDDTLARLRAETLWTHAAFASDPHPLLREAESAARRAVALAPLRSEDYRVLGGILTTRAALGDAPADSMAESAYRTCFELAPMDALALIDYARRQSALGRADRAEEALRRAASLYPEQVGRALAAPR